MDDEVEKHYREGAVDSKQGVELVWKKWTARNLPPSRSTPQGTIMIVHGYGEHILRYNHVAESFAAVGFDVVGWDHAGHGSSAGTRGILGKYEFLTDEITTMLDHHQPQEPVFLYGHSMGGNVVWQYALDHMATCGKTIAGILTTSPYFRKAYELPPFTKALAFLGWHFLPNMVKDSSSKGLLTSDPQVNHDVNNDPLCHNRGSGGLYMRLELAGENSMKRAGDVTFPYCIALGDKDEIIDHKGSMEVHELTKSTDKDVRVFEGAGHEVHNEVIKVRKEVVQYLVDWALARVPPATPLTPPVTVDDIAANAGSLAEKDT